MGIERPWPLNIVLSHVIFQAHMPHMDIIYIYIFPPNRSHGRNGRPLLRLDTNVSIGSLLGLSLLTSSSKGNLEAAKTVNKDKKRGRHVQRVRSIMQLASAISLYYDARMLSRHSSLV